jgi:TatD DNase family protein
MYIDTHCHLTFPDFDEDRITILGNAKKAGVKKFIIPSISIPTSQKALLFANTKQENVFAAIGCHPYDVKNYPDTRTLEHMIGDNVVAIGECGLDYHAYKGYPAVGKKDEQKQLFEEQLLLALRHNLPVIIHCREAFNDIFDVLDGLPSMPKGVFHCFGGGPDDIKQVEKRGFYFGVDGNITYSKQLALTIPLIPLHKLLLETDSPLLPPVPHRGERNEPKYLPLIAKMVATLKGCSVLEVENQTTINAERVFGI